MKLSRSTFLKLRTQTKVDRETGQVFAETILAAPLDNDRDWADRTHFEIDLAKCYLPPRLDDRSGRKARVKEVIREIRRSSRIAEEKRISASSRESGVRGARSLALVAIETILAHTASLSPDLLLPLPYRLLDDIWEQVKARQLVSFRTWQTFSTVLREDHFPINLMRYREQIMVPKSPLHVYTDALTSSSFEFLTFLSITINFRVPELVKLSDLKNIVALEIVVGEGLPYDGVSDQMMHTWSSLVESEGAFRVLRVMKLWNHQRLTKNALMYLNFFPALALYDVTGSSIALKDASKALSYGWKPTVESNVLAKFEAACVERAVRLRDTLGKEPLPVRKPFSQQLPDDAIVRYMPRSEVPQFLARNEVTIKASKSPLMAMKNAQGEVYSSSSSLETWDFPLYTAVSRIGELRNDNDLEAAGIAIGNQPTAGDTLLCSLPIVSLRLGGTPLFLQSDVNNNIHRTFYESHDGPSGSSNQFALQWSEYSRGLETLGTQRLAFTKIKFDQPTTADRLSMFHIASKRRNSGSSRPTSSGEPVGSKRRSRDLLPKQESFIDILKGEKLNPFSASSLNLGELHPHAGNIPSSKSNQKSHNFRGLFNRVKTTDSNGSCDPVEPQVADTAPEKRKPKVLRKKKSLGDVLGSFLQK